MVALNPYSWCCEVQSLWTKSFAESLQLFLLHQILPAEKDYSDLVDSKILYIAKKEGDLNAHWYRREEALFHVQVGAFVWPSSPKMCASFLAKSFDNCS